MSKKCKNKLKQELSDKNKAYRGKMVLTIVSNKLKQPKTI